LSELKEEQRAARAIAAEKRAQERRDTLHRQNQTIKGVNALPTSQDIKSSKINSIEDQVEEQLDQLLRMAV